jgi:GNAT superfamily N-acetyltransferase
VPGPDIRPLTAATWDALAALFSEGGDPRWCWCAWFRRRGLDWSNSTPESNRDLLRRLVDEGPRPPGLVALRDGRGIGWVSVGPREEYERLAQSRVLARVDDQPVWSIVCFVVSRRERGRGLATALLEAAIEHARSQGARLLEAYPVHTGGQRIASSSAYHGTLRMFERAGFRVVTERRATAGSRPRPIMRLEL